MNAHPTPDREILLRLEARLAEATALLHKVERFLEQNFDLGAQIAHNNAIKAASNQQKARLKQSAHKFLQNNHE